MPYRGQCTNKVLQNLTGSLAFAWPLKALGQGFIRAFERFFQALKSLLRPLKVL
jgi:hypothetical protein